MCLGALPLPCSVLSHPCGHWGLRCVCGVLRDVPPPCCLGAERGRGPVVLGQPPWPLPGCLLPCRWGHPAGRVRSWEGRAGHRGAWWVPEPQLPLCQNRARAPPGASTAAPPASRAPVGRVSLSPGPAAPRIPAPHLLPPGLGGAGLHLAAICPLRGAYSQSGMEAPLPAEPLDHPNHGPWDARDCHPLGHWSGGGSCRGRLVAPAGRTAGRAAVQSFRTVHRP